MLIKFVSSETGEVLMFAEVAKTLLEIVGKATTARGVFTQPEMLAAAKALQHAVQEAGKRPLPEPEDDEESEETSKKPKVVLSQRAWPLIDMLERTAGSGPDANIVWEAPADF